jgi:hypothetical protein
MPTTDFVVEPRLSFSPDLFDLRGGSLPSFFEYVSLPAGSFPPDSPEATTERYAVEVYQFLKPLRPRIDSIVTDALMSGLAKRNSLGAFATAEGALLTKLREKHFADLIDRAQKAHTKLMQAENPALPAQKDAAPGPDFVMQSLAALSVGERVNVLVEAARSGDPADAAMVAVVLNAPQFLRRRLLDEKSEGEVRAAVADARDPGAREWAIRTRQAAQFCVDTHETARRWLASKVENAQRQIV